MPEAISVLPDSRCGRFSWAARLLNTTVATGAQTTRNYLANKPVTITATGTYKYDTATTADAECTKTTTDANWLSGRPGVLGDVTIGGSSNITWHPAAGTCDATTNAYTFVYTPSVTGPLSFGIADTSFADNNGTLTITVAP